MIRFSTDVFPEAERFDGWREEIQSQFLDVDVTRLDRPEHGPFQATDDVLQLGDLALVNCSGTPRNFSRSRAQVADGNDVFGFCVNLRGAIELSQGGSTVVDREPNIVLVDAGRPFDRFAVVDNEPTSEQSSMINCYNFILPRQALLTVAPGAENYVGRSLKNGGQGFQFLMRYAEKLMNSDELTSAPVLAKCVGDHLIDLIALLVGPTRDAMEIASSRGLRAGRLMQILSYIDGNLGNPALSAKLIADQHGISVRYVSQLMEDKGETISRYILRLRVEKVARMLSDPATSSMRVADVALACGFNDISSLNRAFKTQFGWSP